MFRQRLLHWLVYVGTRLVAMFMMMFPIDMNMKTARLLGWIWYRFSPRHRDRARDHLRIAYDSTLSDEAIERITLRSMQQLAMLAAGGVTVIVMSPSPGDSAVKNISS